MTSDPDAVLNALARLPATRDEARAIGDVLILGEAATEGGLLSAISKRTRWRAVHLACHGLIDPDQPTLSSLALTPDTSDDGFLTCLEIFRAKIFVVGNGVTDLDEREVYIVVPPEGEEIVIY